MTREFVLLAEFLPAILQKKEAVHALHSQGTSRGKSLFFHKYSIAQNVSNCKLQMVSDTFSISYFLQNTTTKPQNLQDLPAAYKKQAATNAACNFISTSF